MATTVIETVGLNVTFNMANEPVSMDASVPLPCSRADNCAGDEPGGSKKPENVCGNTGKCRKRLYLNTDPKFILTHRLTK